MTNMKKRISIALVVVMIAMTAMTATAFAAETTKPADAGIAFTAGSAPEIIPPIDVPNPDKPNFSGFAVQGIDFGSWAIDDITGPSKTYSSDNARAGKNKTTGIIIKNGTLGGWKVQVKMTGFTANSTPTLNGAKLTLIQNTAPTSTTGNASVAPTLNNNLIVNTADQKILSAAVGAGTGIWGCDWKGALEVVNGTITSTGEASATMTWTVTVGP